MIIPDVGTNINYSYTSSILKMDLNLSVDNAGYGCRLVKASGAFIGRYYAAVMEDEDFLHIIRWGKGFINIVITEDDIKTPIVSISKNDMLEGKEIYIGRYSIRLYKSNVDLTVMGREYKGCLILLAKYDKGFYLVTLKSNVGLISIQNIVNNIVKEEIFIKEG